MAADETGLTEPGGKVRLFVEPALGDAAVVTLDEGQAHYLRHVMRARNGDAVQLFNGRDGEWRAVLDLTHKRDVKAALDRRTRAQGPADDLWFCFAPIKKTAAEFLSQKATELGASVLQPVITRRTIVARVNIDRIRANAVEAAEQSDRLDVPECRAPSALTALLGQWPAGRTLIFCDEGGAPPMLEALKGQNLTSAAILAGPEGGFDPQERAAIRALPNCVPVSLGPRILRADTAALAALAVFQAARG